ncbi:MAG: MFS transporter [Tissierellia bacterium]|nr:MFS transporter [Tissierellia bacterium]
MKIRIYSLIMFLNSYLTGLLTPVLSLALIDKGASLSNLSIILGLYALSVILLELPTGIMADIFGRKKTFVLSLIIFTLCFALLLIGRGFIVLCIVMMLYGLAKALASGSFDALFIDYYIDNFGKDKLHNITTRLSVLEALGLSAGALSGGFFPEISNKLFSSIGTYDLNIIVRVILTITVIVLSILFISDNAITEKKQHISIKQHVKNSSTFVFKNTTILCIFLSVFSTGFFLSALETYWQPHFITFLPDGSSTRLLGLMAFLYLGAAMIGSIISNNTIKKYKFNLRKMYLLMRAFIALLLIVTALQTNVPLFIAFYASIYLMFGMSMIPEGVILNSETPNEIRASVLSVKSFTMQIGGLSGSLLYSILIKFISIPTIWILAAFIVLITIAIIAVNFIKSEEKVAL